MQKKAQEQAAFLRSGCKCLNADKAPALPDLAAVADAGAPTVSDAPVFRGRDEAAALTTGFAPPASPARRNYNAQQASDAKARASQARARKRKYIEEMARRKKLAARIQKTAREQAARAQAQGYAWARAQKKAGSGWADGNLWCPSKTLLGKAQRYLCKCR